MDLKANTAVDVLIGPFVDSTDGDTAETGLTIAQADVRLSKNGQNMAQKSDATSCVHDELGYYNCELDATDTNTEGSLVLVVHESGALTVRHEFNILSEAAWDSLYGAKDTGYMDVNIKAVSEDTTAADNLEADYDGTGYNKSASTIGTCSANTDLVSAAAVVNEWETQSQAAPTGFHVNVLEVNGTAQTANDNGADINAILTDTNSLNDTKIPDTISLANINGEVDTALTDIKLDHLVAVADSDDVVNNSIMGKLAASDGDWSNFVSSTESLQAIRDRGDTAWITGGGGGITDILNIQPLIPNDIDLAGTATVRIGLGLTNMVDDLPSTGEITPGTITIDRKAIGGTSWSNIVNAAACSEAAGLIYYDEVFDSGSTYAEGDSLRITFKSQKITVAANDYEITDATGWIFQTSIRQTMRGTDGANTTVPDAAGTVPTTAEFEARTLVAADYTVVSDLGTVQSADHTASIADIPTVAEFNARSIPSADYVVVGDTLARVTLVDTVTTNTDMVAAAPTVGDIRTEMEGDGYDISALVEALINKQIIEEATGATEVFNDAGVSQGTVATAFTTDGTYTTRKQIRI